ncbi:ABC transporter permease [Janthinobacterium agaricidamnosum]|uniref:Permease family protein n=1 Tax=Janthinobacterium agaricidamnosum NBRC 102515 = DSM 9628 TaxID=1349767 RepID=W0VD32_9BURK|nr:ABC transporter permease [Janthinobacterium agaricidamnosum]CDG85560.1 permease family protein [Janthinobacterium agaricidamnosum NBRC 102515 = DSM 9628]
MFQYYFVRGLLSLRRSPALTALMILTLAVGVAASISTLTILHMMSADPLPHKSDRMFVPVIDTGPLKGYAPGEPIGITQSQTSYRDIGNFLNSKIGVRRTAMYGVAGPVEPQRKDIGVFRVQGLAPTRDFFAMFETPFLYGQPWSEADDASGADIIVLTRRLAEKLYGAGNPVGQRMTLMGQQFQVGGVLDRWDPVPRVHHLIGSKGAFGAEDDFFIPLSSAIRHQASQDGGVSCASEHSPGFQGVLDSECTWLQFWFEMAGSGERGDLQNYLDNYAAEQRKLGRMQRNAPNQLFNVNEWMRLQNVVDNDNRLAAWLAFGFLLLCLVNTIGLLLAKFSTRAAEVGIRRALGASKPEIFRQFLVETTVIGLAGGLLGLLLAYAALALISLQSEDLGVVAHMDGQMLLLTFGVSVLAALLAGLLPTWRACQVTPAMQLKSQ